MRQNDKNFLPLVQVGAAASSSSPPHVRETACSLFTWTTSLQPNQKPRRTIRKFPPQLWHVVHFIPKGWHGKALHGIQAAAPPPPPPVSIILLQKNSCFLPPYSTYIPAAWMVDQCDDPRHISFQNLRIFTACTCGLEEHHMVQCLPEDKCTWDSRDFFSATSSQEKHFF